MTTVLDIIRYNSGIAGEEVADMVDSLEREVSSLREQVEKLKEENKKLRKASPASAPEGWKLVPVVPTEEILVAMTGFNMPENNYRAMLAAAPTPPVSEDRKDAELLDYIQNHGATIQIVPMANRTFGFEVGGLHKSRKLSVREAIDAAMQDDKP